MSTIMSELTREMDKARIEGLESLQMDPKLRRTFELVRIYNELLADEPVSKDIAEGIIAEIDSEWSDLLGITATFTGRAKSPNEFDPEKAIATGYFEDIEVQFRGAVAAPVKPMDDSADIPEIESYYHLGIGFQREAIDSDGDRVFVDVVAVPDDIASLEFPDIMSRDRARWILQELQPDLIDDIDAALLNDAEEESDRTLRLAGLHFQPSGDEEADKQIKGALNVYTQTAMPFDTHNGYHYSFNGPVWLKNKDEQFVTCHVVSESIATIRGIAWLETPEDGNVLVPHLDMLLCQDEVEDSSDMYHAHVPVSSITYLRSLRRIFFSHMEQQAEQQADS
jgi:hypothetical protein